MACALGLNYTAYGQIMTCGTDTYYESLSKSKSNHVKQLQLRSAPILPVVIHIVWYEEGDNLSDEAIARQIERLNLDFNHNNTDRADIPADFSAAVGDPQIRFCLASVDPAGNPHPGIIRTRTLLNHIGSLKDSQNRFLIHYTNLGGQSAWPPNKYINIWVGRMENIFGRSTIGGMVPVPEEDGIVIDPRYFTISPGTNMLGRTLVHEMGHYLGLKHTWGMIIGDCDEDDGLADTPFQTGPYFDCPSHPQYSCDQKNMFMNHMDFVDDYCSKFFTRDQVNLMWSTLANSRSQLINQSIQCAQAPTSVSLDNIKIKVMNGAGVVHIQTQLPLYPIYYTIYNSSGQSLTESELFILPAAEVYIKDWPVGIYFLYFRYNKEQRVIKFLKY